MRPSAERSAQPAVVPRSRARIVPWGMPNDCSAAGLVSAAGRVRVVEAMMVSVEGNVVVRAATERFLAELSVVVRLCGVAGARRTGVVGLSERDRMRQGAHHSTSLSRSGGLGIGHREKPAIFLGLVNVVNVCECFSGFSIA